MDEEREWEREKERERDRGKLSIKDDRIRQLFKCLYVTHLPNCIKTTSIFISFFIVYITQLYIYKR